MAEETKEAAAEEPAKLHPKTKQLADLTAELESECAALDAIYDEAQADYEKATEAALPFEQAAHLAEAKMDAVKPRRRELHDQLAHLRKVTIK